MRGTLGWTAAAASALVLVACGSEPQDEDADSNGGNGPIISEGQYSLAGELAYLPSSDEGTMITIQASDFERVGEILGEDKPTGADADFDDLLAWVKAASLPADDRDLALATIFPDSLGWGQYAMSTAVINETLGVSLRDVTRFAEVVAPPRGATVVHGLYDTDRITTALGEPHEGMWSIGEELSVDPEMREALPPVGAGLRVAEADDRLLLFREQAPLEAVTGGTGPTLAEDPTLVALAEALDALGWYSTMIVAHHDYSGSTAGELALEPFTALGAAVDVVDGQDVVHLVYAHGDAETAAANEAKLATLVEEGQLVTGQPIGERLELLETRVDGAVLTASFTPIDSPPGIVWNMIAQRDALTTHG